MPPSNRAILLTPPGGAAIAVLRLTGPGIAPFLREHFSKPSRPGRCVHGELAAYRRMGMALLVGVIFVAACLLLMVLRYPRTSALIFRLFGG